MTARIRAGLGLLAFVLLLSGSAGAQSNVLLLIADDLGVDRVGAYGLHPDPGHTPVIDQLATAGVMFTNCWSAPTCSPARAAMLTGRYGYRTGMGTFIEGGGNIELNVTETSIPDVIGGTHRTAVAGKWHLGSQTGFWLQHPYQLGFEFHRGSFSNLPNANGATAYYEFLKAYDGSFTTSTTYATTDTVDDALSLITGFASDPWFLWVAFNAPHKPYHHPPASLHTYTLPPEINDDPLFMKALTEAMDTEIGRLLASIPPGTLANTYIIFVGDNGTTSTATTAPFDPTHAKGTMYQGGVQVPLIISGPGVDPGQVDSLVNATDLFATIIEMAGHTPPASGADAVSMVPYLSLPRSGDLRPNVFAEKFKPNNLGSGNHLTTVRERTVRNDRYKLIFVYSGMSVATQQLFDLDADPFETVNLMDFPLDFDAQMAYDELLLAFEGLQMSPWGDTFGDLGHGLAGTYGVPTFTGTGTLGPNDNFSLSMTGALENAPAFLVLGVSYPYPLTPFKGGKLVPSPDVVIGLTTNGLGEITFPSVWPAGTPAGAATYLQYWIQDGGGPFGWSASNALNTLTPL